MNACKPFTPCDPNAPVPEPVLPRCQDVALPTGTFTNATVVVQDGCIVQVSTGAAPLYTPDPCCAPVGGGGGDGGQGLQGPPGPAGASATVNIGTVTTAAPGQPARVNNTGTTTNAILNFVIPQGQTGEAGQSPTGVSGSFAGMDIENGAIQRLPVAWPPVMQIQTAGGPAGVLVSASKDPTTGDVLLTVDLGGYDSDLRADFQALLDAQEGRIDAMQAQLAQLQERVTALCAGQPCP